VESGIREVFQSGFNIFGHVEQLRLLTYNFVLFSPFWPYIATNEQYWSFYILTHPRNSQVCSPFVFYGCYGSSISRYGLRLLPITSSRNPNPSLSYCFTFGFEFYHNLIRNTIISNSRFSFSSGSFSKPCCGYIDYKVYCFRFMTQVSGNCLISYHVGLVIRVFLLSFAPMPLRQRTLSRRGGVNCLVSQQRQLFQWKFVVNYFDLVLP